MYVNFDGSWLPFIRNASDTANSSTTSNQLLSNPWISGICITVISGLILSFILFVVKYFSQKRQIQPENDKLKYAHEKAITLLKKVLAGQNEQSIFAVETLIINEFKECNISLSLVIDRLPDIISDVIAELYCNDYIPEVERIRIVNRAINMLRTCRGEAALRESLKQWKDISIPATILSIIYAITGGLIAFLIVMVSYIHILMHFHQQVGTQLYQAYWFAFAVILELAVIMIIRNVRRRSQVASSLKLALEAEAIRVIQTQIETSQTERKVRLMIEGKWVQSDLVIDVKGKKLPVAILTSPTQQSDIARLNRIMQSLSANSSLLLATSKISKIIRDSSESANILVIDNIISEKDISNQLYLVKLFK